MTTPASRLREIVLEVVSSAHPHPVSLDRLYGAVEVRIDFDADDLRPPKLHDGHVKEPSWKRNVRNVLQGMKGAGSLVNARRDAWRLPTPDPAAALELSTAWLQVRQAAETAVVQKSEIRSFDESQLLGVREVVDDRITLLKLDSGLLVTLTRAEVERGVIHINAAGGRVGRGTINKALVKEIAMVSLHPQLHWDEASGSIVTLHTASSLPVYRDFGEAPDDDPEKLNRFARRVRAGQRPISG